MLPCRVGVRGRSKIWITIKVGRNVVIIYITQEMSKQKTNIQTIEKNLA